MPLLKPRLVAKRKGKKRKTTTTSIKRLRRIDTDAKGRRGIESRMYEVEVRVKKRGKERSRKMVEKEFRIVSNALKEHYGDQFANPKKQFDLIQELMELNREQRLGLRIRTTVRLRKRLLKKPTLIQTLLDPDMRVLDRENIKYYPDFLYDVKRQQGILKEHGYTIGGDGFFPVKNKETAAFEAVLADFGTLKRIKKKDK